MGVIPAGPFGNRLPFLSVAHMQVGSVVLHPLFGRRNISRIHRPGHEPTVEQDLETPARVVSIREDTRAASGRGGDYKSGKNVEESREQNGGHTVDQNGC